MWDAVGDVCEDIFGCVHAIQDRVHTQHVIDGLPLWQDGGHLQPLLGVLFGNLCRLGTNKRVWVRKVFIQQEFDKGPILCIIYFSNVFQQQQHGFLAQAQTRDSIHFPEQT